MLTPKTTVHCADYNNSKHNILATNWMDFMHTREVYTSLVFYRMRNVMDRRLSFSMWILHAVALVAGLMLSTAHAASPKKSAGSDSTTLSGGVTSDPLWDLEIPRQELEAVLMRLVQAYEGGNIEQFMALIAPHVRTEAGLLRAQVLREEYVETFLGSHRRRMILRNVHWTRANDGVVADADFVSYVTSRRDDSVHERSGAARFHLTKPAAEWIISELYFSYDH